MNKRKQIITDVLLNDNSETAIRFALWHGVFSVEVSKSYKNRKS